MNNLSSLYYLSVCATLLAACSQDRPPQQAPATTAAPVARPAPDSAVALAAPAAQRATDATAKPAATSASTVYQLLQGKWRSTIDTLDVVEFKNHDYIDYYDQKRLSQKTFRLDKACPGAKEAGAAGDNERYLVVNDMCWHIAVLDNSSLELEYTDGGKILVYSKMQ